MVGLPGDVLRRYPRLTLYNSPYVAHDRGCAVDLYPDAGGTAPSPVAGEVVAVRTVRAPPKPYAPEHDHLVVLDVDEAATGVEPSPGESGDYLARVLHVEPTVEPGDEVAVGDSLGRLVRAGFFAPWVGTHLHVGLRERGANPVRAAGSLRVEPGIEARPVAWDGTGTVVEAGDTYAVLDAPAHPAPGECFAGVAAAVGGAAGGGLPTALDGGLPHYDGGGALGDRDATGGPVSLLGTTVGTADGRDVTWGDVEVRADGRPVTGLSLFLGLEELYAKLVCPGVAFEAGERVAVSVHRPG